MGLLSIIVQRPPPLGRWKIKTYNIKLNIKLNNKIDLSNEDHYGHCREYGITNKNSMNLLENDKLNNMN